MQSPATDDEIEDTLNFQLEELSKMADDELSLIPKMAEWKPWDVPAGMLIAWHLSGLTGLHALPTIDLAYATLLLSTGYTIPQISEQEVGEKLDAAK